MLGNAYGFSSRGGVAMELSIESPEMAAAVLVGLGLATFSELGVNISPVQTHLVYTGQRFARGLNFRPEEKKAAISRCREILGLA